MKRAAKKKPGEPAVRIADALEDIAASLERIRDKIEKGTEALRRDIWGLEKAIRGEHRELD